MLALSLLPSKLSVMKKKMLHMFNEFFVLRAANCAIGLHYLESCRCAQVHHSALKCIGRDR
jgi:hypothetical protein